MACGIRKTESYPETVRNFCIGLKNISPAGYRFIRKEFNDRIPSEVTIRNWYSNADLNCNPGIIKYSLKVLKRKVEEMAVNNQKLVGALLFDEVAIHKLLQFTNNEMIGFENVPTKDPKNAKIASEALVYLFNGINSNIKLPVAYYYIDKLDGEAKATLLEEIIASLLEVGVIVTSVTFDGAKSNPRMCQMLGANLNVFSDTFDPSFMRNDNRVNVIYDPSHNIKLVRGTLANKIIFDSDRRPIKWIFFKKLVEYKIERNYGETIHKMTRAHINYESNDMKVKLAVETLSASTANSMEYLMNGGHSDFKEAVGTIK